MSPHERKVADAQRRVVAFAVELVRRMDIRSRLYGGPARPADMHALIRAVDELRDAEEQAARAAPRKFGELDYVVGDEACVACHRRFEPDDNVTSCADCDVGLHVSCTVRHFWQCERRQN